MSALPTADVLSEVHSKLGLIAAIGSVATGVRHRIVLHRKTGTTLYTFNYSQHYSYWVVEKKLSAMQSRIRKIPEKDLLA